MTIDPTDKMLVQRGAVLYSSDADLANGQDSDVLIINRNNTDCKITIKAFKDQTNTQPTDYLLVNRGGVDYKATVQDWLDAFTVTVDLNYSFKVDTRLADATGSNAEFLLLVVTGSDNFVIDWGDGNTQQSIGGTEDYDHTYATAGEHTITVTVKGGGAFSPSYGLSFGGNTNDPRIKGNAKTVTEIVSADSGFPWSDLRDAWGYHTALTSFPLLDTSSVKKFDGAWSGCTGLTSFPLLDTSSGEIFRFTWNECTGLTTFPKIDTSSGTDFTGAWSYCSKLTSFPLLDTSSGKNFTQAWNGCTGLTSFPLLNTSSGDVFYHTWYGCTGLTIFPKIDTSSGTDFTAAWNGCTGLTSFPLLDTSSGTSFSQAWNQCTGLTSFPKIDTSSGENFSYAWNFCTKLTSFPLLDFSRGTDFGSTWNNCKLDQQSVINVLTALDAVPFAQLTNKTTLIGTSLGPSAWRDSTKIEAALRLIPAINTLLNSLTGKGWTLFFN